MADEGRAKRSNKTGRNNPGRRTPAKSPFWRATVWTDDCHVPGCRCGTTVSLADAGARDGLAFGVDGRGFSMHGLGRGFPLTNSGVFLSRIAGFSRYGG